MNHGLKVILLFYTVKKTYCVSYRLHRSFKECLWISYANEASVSTSLTAASSMYVIKIQIPYLKTVLAGELVHSTLTLDTDSRAKKMPCLILETLYCVEVADHVSQDAWKTYGT